MFDSIIDWPIWVPIIIDWAIWVPIFSLLPLALVAAYFSERFMRWLIFGLSLALLPLFVVAFTIWQPVKNETPIAPPAPNPTISQIKEAQRQLSSAHHYRLKIDGKIGPRTTGALKGFQGSHGLKVTGQLDQQTMSFLIPNLKGGSSLPPGPPNLSQSGETSTAGLSFLRVVTTEELLAVAFALSGAAGVGALRSSGPLRRLQTAVGSLTIFSAFAAVALYLVFKTHSYHIDREVVGNVELISFGLTVALSALSEFIADL
jgi:hypothetical protein